MCSSLYKGRIICESSVLLLYTASCSLDLLILVFREGGVISLFKDVTVAVLILHHMEFIRQRFYYSQSMHDNQYLKLPTLNGTASFPDPKFKIQDLFLFFSILFPKDPSLRLNRTQQICIVFVIYTIHALCASYCQAKGSCRQYLYLLVYIDAWVILNELAFSRSNGQQNIN